MPVKSIAFTVEYKTFPLSELIVSASSDFQTLIKNEKIDIFGTEAIRYHNVTPEADQFGTALITLNVFDSELNSSEQFRVQVNKIKLEWDTNATLTTNNINAVQFIEETILGWLVGIQGRIYNTVDDGSSRDLEGNDLEENMKGISLINNTTGWTVEENGTLLKYTMIE